jgi:hypothetical protein
MAAEENIWTKRDERKAGWRKLYNEEIRNLTSYYLFS